METWASFAISGLLLTEAYAGCSAEYSLLGCYADSDRNRLMPRMGQHDPMSAERCYRLCDDGWHTHFGMQYYNECWCAVEPELRSNGPEVDPRDCNLSCMGTTDGEHCGGIYRVLVYEITAHQACHLEELNVPTEHDPLWLSKQEDEQIIGQPWDYQLLFDTNMFVSAKGASFPLSGDPAAGVCDLDDGHKKLLTQVSVWEGAIRTVPRVFCGIYTHQKNHQTQVKAIKETWASRCDGFVAFSDVADPELNSFKIKHEGPEEYSNMWQKSRAIWKYINFHYKRDFDWFVLGGDDLFVIVENLRKYLLSDEVKHAAGGSENGGTNPMYLGRRFRPSGEDFRTYNSGGASYVLNQAAVGRLASHLDDNACQPHTAKSWEDVMVAMCLRKNGVVAFDTRDAFGRERFHPFTPAVHLGYRMPQKPEDRLVSEYVVGDWYIDQTFDLKFGLECCSPDSVSFHYVDGNLMMRLYHLMYWCPKPALQ